MLILKYSLLGHGLVKFINQTDGLYGAISESTGEIVIAHLYSEFRQFDGNRAVVVKDGQQLEVDPFGNEYLTIQGCANLSDFFFVQKADRCPNCFDEKKRLNIGCHTCSGYGFIGANLRYDNID